MDVRILPAKKEGGKKDDDPEHCCCCWISVKRSNVDPSGFPTPQKERIM